MILMPKEESAKKTDKKDGSPAYPKTLAGVLQAGLDVKEPLTVEKTVLYQHGDRNWSTRHFASSPAEPTQQESLPPTEQTVTIQLAAKPKRTSKNLTRMTPSGQEGAGGVERASLAYTTGSSHSPLTTSHSPLDWGTAMHACFEQITWLENGLPERDKLLDLVTPIMRDTNAAVQVVDAFYASCKLPDVQTALSLGTYRDAVSVSNSSALRCEVQNERRFWAIPQSDVLLQGSIDRLVLLYDDSSPKPRVIQADVMDFKSNRVENDETLTGLVAHYAPQLAEYRKAVAAMYGLSNDQITTRLLFTEPGKIVTV
jgi:ATP-dependent exoDNAse (exonuclease V) beta subunit